MEIAGALSQRQICSGVRWPPAEDGGGLASIGAVSGFRGAHSIRHPISGDSKLIHTFNERPCRTHKSARQVAKSLRRRATVRYILQQYALLLRTM